MGGACSKDRMVSSRELNQRAAAAESAALMESCIASRSRSARRVSSTRHGMFLAHVAEYLGCRTGSTSCDVFFGLAETFALIHQRCASEELLVRFGVLNDGSGSSIHGEDDGAAGLAQLLQHLDGVIAECGQRLNVLFEIHGRPFRGI
jgi:hypothetical protein